VAGLETQAPHLQCQQGMVRPEISVCLRPCSQVLSNMHWNSRKNPQKFVFPHNNLTLSVEYNNNANNNILLLMDLRDRALQPGLRRRRLRLHSGREPSVTPPLPCVPQRQKQSHSSFDCEFASRKALRSHASCCKGTTHTHTHTHTHIYKKEKSSFEC
jgi:hypothetical protein